MTATNDNHGLLNVHTTWTIFYIKDCTQMTCIHGMTGPVHATDIVPVKIVSTEIMTNHDLLIISALIRARKSSTTFLNDLTSVPEMAQFRETKFGR